MKQQDELWAFWANRNGYLWKKPQRVKLISVLCGFWHKDGNTMVNEEGLDINSEDGYLAFASHDKKEVQKFIDGFMACRDLMAAFYVD